MRQLQGPEEAWKQMYKLIFPDTAEDDIPSPYVEGDIRLEDHAHFARFIGRRLYVFIDRRLHNWLCKNRKRTEECACPGTESILVDYIKELLEEYFEHYDLRPEHPPKRPDDAAKSGSFEPLCSVGSKVSSVSSTSLPLSTSGMHSEGQYGSFNDRRDTDHRGLTELQTHTSMMTPALPDFGSDSYVWAFADWGTSCTANPDVDNMSSPNRHVLSEGFCGPEPEAQDVVLTNQSIYAAASDGTGENHKHVATKPAYFCTFCAERGKRTMFQSKQDWKRHEQDQHMESGLSWPCDMCRHTSHNGSEAQKHAKKVHAASRVHRGLPKPSPRARNYGCGFGTCAKRFDSWKDRCKHVAECMQSDDFDAWSCTRTVQNMLRHRDVPPESKVAIECAMASHERDSDTMHVFREQLMMLDFQGCVSPSCSQPQDLGSYDAATHRNADAPLGQAAASIAPAISSGAELSHSTPLVFGRDSWIPFRVPLVPASDYDEWVPSICPEEWCAANLEVQVDQARNASPAYGGMYSGLEGRDPATVYCSVYTESPDAACHL
ncbi:hypothetical protein DPSP01_003979 [Paraphaeosphaeria sporulosa]